MRNPGRCCPAGAEAHKRPLQIQLPPVSPRRDCSGPDHCRRARRRCGALHKMPRGDPVSWVRCLERHDAWIHDRLQSGDARTIGKRAKARDGWRPHGNRAAAGLVEATLDECTAVVVRGTDRRRFMTVVRTGREVHAERLDPAVPGDWHPSEREAQSGNPAQETHHNGRCPPLGGDRELSIPQSSVMPVRSREKGRQDGVCIDGASLRLRR